MRLWLPTLAIAYLLGSIPFGYILVRIFRKVSAPPAAAPGIGATNVATLRPPARAFGILTLLLDLLKGYAAVFARRPLRSRNARLSVGSRRRPRRHRRPSSRHDLPVWLGFKGGKGVTTAFGVFIAIAPHSLHSALSDRLRRRLRHPLTSLSSILAAVMMRLLPALDARPLAPLRPNAELSHLTARHCQAPPTSRLMQGKRSASFRQQVGLPPHRPPTSRCARGRIAVTRRGAWGTALAISLATAINFASGRTLPEHAHNYSPETGENVRYLSRLHPSI